MKIPKLDTYVNDFSRVLSKQTRHELNEAAAKIEKESSLQVVTVIFPHRKWRELKDIALEVFNENGIGQEWKNNGLLLIISSEEKKIRIMVWKWLEWLMNEKWCKNIIEKKLRPLLNKWSYSELIQVWQESIIIFNPKKLSNTIWGILFWFFWVFLAPFMFMLGLMLGSIQNKIALVFIAIIALWIILNIIKRKKWKILAVIFLFLLLWWSYTSYKEKAFCEQNPQICQQRKIEAEKRKHIWDSSSNYKSSHTSSSSRSSSSSSRSSSSSFQWGWWSSNGAGWWD